MNRIIIKKSAFRVVMAASFILCAYIFHRFSLNFEDAITRMCIVSTLLALISAFTGAYLSSEDYVGFFKSVATIDVLNLILICIAFEIISFVMWIVLAYLLYFPSAFICYFVLQGYEVRRSGGH